MPPTSKKARLSSASTSAVPAVAEDELPVDAASASEADEEGSSAEEGEGSEEDEESAEEEEEEERDTDDELADLQAPKKTLKRKRHLSPTAFGSLLSTLASAPPTMQILAGTAKQIASARSTARAKRVLRGEKREREEVGRVRDVVGGWAVRSEVVAGEGEVDAGAEKERRLRKVAQRGVVKLFNAILTAQRADARADEERAAAPRGMGKARLPAPIPKGTPGAGKKKKEQPGADAKKKVAGLDKEGFLDMIRGGGN